MLDGEGERPLKLLVLRANQSLSTLGELDCSAVLEEWTSR